MSKTNCWEIKKCGRQAGGVKTQEFGVCPAAVERKLDGVHGGMNAGRACWALTGTLCGGSVQGSYAQKEGNCLACNFYKQVKEEEAGHFMMVSHLFAKLKA
ncbi:MAG: hypothetical protein HY810_07710 [Candidatus Omnitrophica bacterium]|nr:hypothetical protein [Candidatus Omnitrophota bacterium]